MPRTFGVGAGVTDTTGLAAIRSSVSGLVGMESRSVSLEAASPRRANAGQQFISRNAADLTEIRGDRAMVENTRDVTATSLDKRSGELASLHAFIAASPLYPKVKALENAITAYQARGVLQVDNSQDYREF
jgi:hypothetical protein